jgi:hypothetical protein
MWMAKGIFPEVVASETILAWLSLGKGHIGF